MAKNTMTKFDKNKIKKLALMLRMMDRDKAYYILLSLVNELSVTHPKMIQGLKGELINPVFIFEELSEKDLRTVIRNLDEKVMCAVAATSKRILGYITRYLSQARQKELVDTIGKLKIDGQTKIRAADRFFDTVIKLSRENKISYSGILQVLFVPGCAPVKEKKKQGAVFFCDKNSYHTGEAINLFISASTGLGGEIKGNTLHLFYMKDGKKYYSKNRRFQVVHLDENGCAVVTMKGFILEGIYRLILEDPGREGILASLDLFVMSSARSLIELRITEFSKEEVAAGYHVHCEVGLQIRGKKLDSSIRYAVLCSRCGNMISGGVTECKEGTAVISFYSEKHPGKFLIEIKTRGNRSVSFITPCLEWSGGTEPEEDDKINFEVPDVINRGEPLTAGVVSAGSVAPLFLITVSDINADTTLLKQRILNTEGIIISEGPDSPVNGRLRDYLSGGQIRLFRATDPAVFIHWFKVFGGGRRTFSAPVHSLASDAKALRMEIFRKKLDGTLVYSFGKDVHLREKPLYFDFPVYVGKGEFYEGSIFYNTPAQAKMIVHNGHKEELDVDGRGSYTLKVTSSSKVSAELIPLQPGDGVQRVKAEWSPMRRTKKVQTIHFFPPGGAFSVNGRATIYFNPSFLEANIIEGVLDFPWGCGEQTAAKLGALAILYKLVRGRTISHEGREHNEEEVLSRIEEGANRMRLFKKGNGLYSLWEKSAGHLKITDGIHTNLLPYQSVSLSDRNLNERIKGMMGEMVSALEKAESEVKAENRKLTEGRIIDTEEAYNLYFSEEEKDRAVALKYINSHGRIKEGRISFMSKSIWGGSHYATLLALEILVRESIDRMDLITDFDEKKEEVPPPHIFAQILTTLGILKRKYRVNRIPFFKKFSNVKMKIFNQVCAGLENHLLSSTRATMQFLNVFRLFTGDEVPVYEIDGKEYTGSEGTLEIKNPKGSVKSGIGIIEVSSDKEISLSKGGPCRIDIRPGKDRLKNNETFSIKIVMRGERPFTPIMRLYLPANIEITNRENVRREEQMVELTVPGDHILLSACAVRKGKGNIKAELGGMYGSEKSWTESPEILVA